MQKKQRKESKDIVTCARGHTGRFIATWNSDPRYKLWYMACATCGCGVYWSGGSNVS